MNHPANLLIAGMLVLAANGAALNKALIVGRTTG